MPNQQSNSAEGTVPPDTNPWDMAWDATKGVVAKVVKAIPDVKMPWEMTEVDVKGYRYNLAVPYHPPTVPVRTEAQMKKAVVIHPHERQPDTQSIPSNFKEIDEELSRKGLSPRERKALLESKASLSFLPPPK